MRTSSKTMMLRRSLCAIHTFYGSCASRAAAVHLPVKNANVFPRQALSLLEPDGCARAVQVTSESMDPEALVALVVFTGVVSVYRLGKGGAAVADVYPGHESSPREVKEEIFRAFARCLAPGATGLSTDPT